MGNQAATLASPLLIGSVLLLPGGGWEGAIITPGRPAPEPATRCGHAHQFPGEAWACIEPALAGRAADILLAAGCEPPPSPFGPDGLF